MKIRYYRHKRKKTIWAVREDGMEKRMSTTGDGYRNWEKWHDPDDEDTTRHAPLEHYLRNFKDLWEEIDEEDIFLDLI